VEPVDERHRSDYSGIRRSVNERARVERRGRERLLADHVFPGANHGESLLGVQRVRCADVRHFDGVVGQQFVEAVIGALHPREVGRGAGAIRGR
jgi:hypothetical protein